MKERSNEPRINNRIRSRELRVVVDGGDALGIMPLRQALEAAASRELDLVEVAPGAKPPVAKIMDYGKFKYHQKKAKKKPKHTVKEVKFRLHIGDHDFNVKKSHAIKFLGQGHRVKLTVTFFGREMAHKDLGFKIMERMLEALAANGKKDFLPKLEGRNLSTMLSPVATKDKPKENVESSE